MVKYLLCAMLAFGSLAVLDNSNAEARFGSRYASAPGWRPGKVLLRFRHANAERRQARRARLFPGVFGSCAVSHSTPSSCPSCPTATTTETVTTTTTVKDCPTGVCPKS